MSSRSCCWWWYWCQSAGQFRVLTFAHGLVQWPVLPFPHVPVQWPTTNSMKDKNHLVPLPSFFHFYFFSKINEQWSSLSPFSRQPPRNMRYWSRRRPELVTSSFSRGSLFLLPKAVFDSDDKSLTLFVFRCTGSKHTGNECKKKATRPIFGKPHRETNFHCGSSHSPL